MTSNSSEKRSSKRKLNLHSILNSSYKKDHERSRVLNGFVLDDELSNDNFQTYWNPERKKLLFSVTGTHNFDDVKTDVHLAFGNLKNTERYKKAHAALRAAKKKYQTRVATVTGHSLGGTIASYIASKYDKVYSYNKGATIGQSNRKHETAYRTEYDAPSYFNVDGNSDTIYTIPSKTPNSHLYNILSEISDSADLTATLGRIPFIDRIPYLGRNLKNWKTFTRLAKLFKKGIRSLSDHSVEHLHGVRHHGVEFHDEHPPKKHKHKRHAYEYEPEYGNEDTSTQQTLHSNSNFGPTKNLRGAGSGFTGPSRYLRGSGTIGPYKHLRGRPNQEF